MSVINNVLKDLENQSSTFTPLDLADVSNKQAHKSTGRNIWLFGGVFLVLILLFVYLFFQSLSKNSETANQVITDKLSNHVENKSPEKKQQPAVLVTSKVKSVTLKKEITGLQINESIDSLELTLQLPLGAQSFLKFSSQNRYVFLLSNASSNILIPEMNDNAWLDNITINETVAGLEIQFDTKDNVLVETNHKEYEASYYWIIRLKKTIQTPVLKADTKISGTLAQLVVENETVAQQTIESQEKQATVEENKTQSVQQQKIKLEIKPVISKESDAELLRKASISMRQRDWLSAQSQLQQLLNSSVDKKARVNLITLLKVRRKTDELKNLLSKSLQKYPQENDFLIEDAALLFSQKQYVNLIRYYNKLDNIQIINLVAASYQRLGQHDNAIDYYQKSLSVDPQQPRKWISLGISQEQKSLFERAMQSYQMALRSGDLTNNLKTFINKRLQQLSANTN